MPFLAVAASVATQIVAPEKRGTAVSYVFAGLTLALAFGVPIGTYLGSVIRGGLVLCRNNMWDCRSYRIDLLYANTKTHSIEDTTILSKP
ncbi:MFS transporter [Rouxiella badensis]|uniref:MFS transporter n=1 Tax=Rouxiella badensis TaxID=1646377 RepID=UPI0017887306|nr:MFS transporter [Rouxiella badensis]QOI57983.1 MFS transporter [Rouxiella badensis subsp. acadiensis]